MYKQLSKTRNKSKLRIGIQLKAVLILTVVVVVITATAGWFYYATTSYHLCSTDQKRILQIAQSLSLAAEQDLQQLRQKPLQHIVTSICATDNLRFAGIVDADGRTMASSLGQGASAAWSTILRKPVSLSDVSHAGQDSLVLCQPIVCTALTENEPRMIGAVRLVLDTSRTAETLANSRNHVTSIAAAIIMCGIPAAYLLVWRVMVVPIRRLAAAVRNLGKGNYQARTKIVRNDEIGDLSEAFDAMADEVASKTTELIQANEQLERKVAERTLQLERANARLREEIAEKEDFLRAVSHDLNAPLRNIAGMAAMILMKSGDQLPDDVTARLRRIQANVDHETSLISELLELSRIRSRPQHRQVADMHQLFVELAESFEFELRKANIDLQISRYMPDLYVEKARVRQMFQNLIDNAIKYIDKRKGGRISVSYDLANGMHVFSVKDNGPGISPEDQQKVFRVFHRCENPRTAAVEGKGVGLAVVKTVASNYDGRAWVQSEVGKGSTFFVSLAAQAVLTPRQQNSQSHRRGLRQCVKAK